MMQTAAVQKISEQNSPYKATYYDEYDVIQVNGDRVVIGIGNTVTAAVNAANLAAA